MGRALVDPVVVTMAVRYCLGRQTYAPGLIAGVVQATWPDLGEQKTIILKDVREWLAEDWHDHPEEDVWRSLLAQHDGAKVPDQCVDYGHHGRDRCVVCGAPSDGGQADG